MPSGIYKRTSGMKIGKNPNSHKNGFKEGNLYGFQKGFIPWNKGMGKYANCNEWPTLREYRHYKGISKRYIGKYSGGRTLTKREHRLLYKYNMKKAGKLTIQTIQQVYEDNIKCFGTLTCIYCFKSVQFGNDSLEHIIPLTKGGTNDYKNLSIACCSCNSMKGNRLIEEILIQ